MFDQLIGIFVLALLVSLFIETIRHGAARERADCELQRLFGQTYLTNSYYTDQQLIDGLLTEVRRKEELYDGAVRRLEQQLTEAKTMREFKL